MPTRLRKLVGMIGILVFLALWVVIAVTLADHLPSHWALQLVYFAIVGFGWGIPLIPFIRWMNRGR